MSTNSLPKNRITQNVLENISLEKQKILNRLKELSMFLKDLNNKMLKEKQKDGKGVRGSV